ncbi:hypothetical protein DFO67_1356 [Modicisalibacter xianhensis]|uniref:Uncharacterized protein n=1 Tax=Modicisalibacter xianhensis TaxID=442341 RepID=A0A4R8F835_9GAMM|nr:hypothetical protein [Halomonas xianhensis]TDX21596.1 hypothetical protein DFO67_1356 [Halomonas xianhensis]
MTRVTDIILCRTAAYQDSGTRHCMRSIVLPSLRKEAAELEECRNQCAVREDWLADWVDAGMLTEEVAIQQAIAQAEKRLAEFDC